MLFFVLLIFVFLLQHFLQHLNQLLSSHFWREKTTLDCEILKIFRPVSNLPYQSKLIEKAIAICLVEQNAITEKFQSAYKAHHGTETALLRVYNDVMFNIDRDNDTLLTAAFEYHGPSNFFPHFRTFIRYY